MEDRIPPIDTIRLTRSLGALLRRTAVKILLPLLSGFALARTGIPGGIYPFAAALAAAVPQGSVTAAMAGVLLGFVLPGNDAETLRCAASALAVAGIKWALAELRPVRESPLFPPAAALTGVVLTGSVVSASVGAMVSYDLARYFAEGALAAACAYFFCGAMEGWRCRRDRALTEQELFCVAAALCVVLIPLCRLRLLGVSPVTAAAMVMVLACCRRFGAPGGGAAGIALGTTLALADMRFPALGVCSAAALTASLFRPLGDIAVSAVFCIGCSLCSLVSGSLDIYLLIEAAAASVTYSIIKGERLAFIFDVIEPQDSSPAVRHGTGAADRLSDAARGLEEASQMVREVSRRLERLDAPGQETIYRRATDEICADCAISRFCWGTAREESQRMFDSLSDILRRDGRLTVRNTPETMRSRCVRWGEMSERINVGYAEYTAEENARRRVARMRHAMSEQMYSCGRLLDELAQESSREDSEGEAMSRQAAELLEEYAVPAGDVECRCGRDGSLTVTLTLRRTDDYPEPEEDVPYILSDGLGLELMQTASAEQGDSVRLRLDSVPAYSLAVATAQHSRRGGRMCGDAFDVLEDQPGSRTVLLSDGMGTGCRAAVDAAMTCGLMRGLLGAGFGEHSAMELVNSAMQISSEDETLATLDCARINLYTGELSLSKAGAAVSYLLREGEVSQISIESLPLGIMERADWGCRQLCLLPEDVVLLVSDGAIGQDGSWLEAQLAQADTEDIQRMAKNILSMASARCGQEDDDITVIILRLEEYSADSRGQAA